MTQLTLIDLPAESTLDAAALEETRGGFAWMSSITALIEQMTMTQNETVVSIFNQGTTGNAFNQVNTSSLSAASPMSFTEIVSEEIFRG